MSSHDYDCCDECAAPLHAHYWSLDRNIEVVSYSNKNNQVHSTATVLESHGLLTACHGECARCMVVGAMASRGYQWLYPGAGPIEHCAKCGKPTDLTKPHVAYAQTFGTEIRKPWLTTFEVSNSELVAVTGLAH